MINQYFYVAHYSVDPYIEIKPCSVSEWHNERSDAVNRDSAQVLEIKSATYHLLIANWTTTPWHLVAGDVLEALAEVIS